MRRLARLIEVTGMALSAPFLFTSFVIVRTTEGVRDWLEARAS